MTESPVESSNNRRFLSKRQKTRIVDNFCSRSNFCMKFSKFYEKVHNLPAFGRILHEKVDHLKSDVHYNHDKQLLLLPGLYKAISQIEEWSSGCIHLTNPKWYYSRLQKRKYNLLEHEEAREYEELLCHQSYQHLTRSGFHLHRSYRKLCQHF